MGCGDVVKFEGFHGGQILKDIGKNPTRLITGVDPFSTKVWNKVLGTNNKPIVDQMGGATKDRYVEAEKRGIDTGDAHKLQDIAHVVAAAYGAAGLGNAAGNIGSSLSAGQGAGAGSAGSTAGYGDSLLNAFGTGTAGGSSVPTATSALPGTMGTNAMAIGDSGMVGAGGASSLPSSIAGGSGGIDWQGLLKQGNQLFGGGGQQQQGQQQQQTLQAPVYNYQPSFNSSQYVQEILAKEEQKRQQQKIQQMQGLLGGQDGWAA